MPKNVVLNLWPSDHHHTTPWGDLLRLSRNWSAIMPGDFFFLKTYRESFIMRDLLYLMIGAEQSHERLLQAGGPGSNGVVLAEGLRLGEHGGMV